MTSVPREPALHHTHRSGVTLAWLDYLFLERRKRRVSADCDARNSRVVAVASRAAETFRLSYDGRPAGSPLMSVRARLHSNNQRAAAARA